jgi:hypothetical protein
MNATTAATRTRLLRRQGALETGFAVLTAVLLLGSTSSPGIVVLVGAMAVWMAFRGQRMTELADPLPDPERRELERLKAESRHVRELVGLLERAGQAPVRYDLARARRLARVESMLNGQA